MKEQSICSNCKRPKGGADGRLTQWIFLCMCDQLRPDRYQNVATDLCRSCGKRIAAGRPGSFTQFVFRFDLCKCAAPQSYLDAHGDTSSSAADTSGDAITQGLEENELNLDKSSFPYGRYRPLAQIGQGASSTVYLCRDRLLGKKVAVKCLRLITTKQLVDFQKEAKATSKLQHPGVVQIIDFGATTNGAPFMVMEYVKGISLERYIAEHGPVPLEAAVKIFSQLTATLSYVNDKGIFHRDIKSSNILISGDIADEPVVKIIDFGVAALKQSTQEPTILQGRSIVGTPAYMSPDQAFGLAYDERSEIYSLGCVLFEALTGSPPFVGDTALETISMHAHKSPPMLCEVGAEIAFPKAVETIARKCLEKDREQRFSHMEDVLYSLRSLDLTPPKKMAKRNLEPPYITGANGLNSDRTRRTKPSAAYLTSFAAIGLVVVGFGYLLIQGIGLLVEDPSVQNSSAATSAAHNELAPLPVRKSRKEIFLEVDRTDYHRLQRNFSASPTRGPTFRRKEDELVIIDGSDDQLKSIDRSKLKKLTLSRGQYTDRGIRYLEPFRRLWYLRFDVESLSEDAFQALPRLKGLRALQLVIRVPLPSKNISSIHRVPALTELVLEKAHSGAAATKLISYEVWNELAKCKRLRTLRMFGIGVDDTDLQALSKFSLTKLTLESIEAGNVESLAKMKDLKTLEIKSFSRGTDKEPIVQSLKKKLPRCEIRTFPIINGSSSK